jgi:predicted nucleic acid-binding protein
MILLDSDIMIDLLRKHSPAIAWIAARGDEKIALIGETALALNLPIHTFNQKHYAAIPNLKTVQPYTRSVQAKETPQP